MESNEVDKATEPLQKAKRESEDSTIVILKKQKKEIDEITNSLTKADLEEILCKVKDHPNKKVEPIRECCFEGSGAEGNNRATILVRGFDCSLPRDDIKTTLMKHFGSCENITRVFVPFECLTGSPLGFAFIDLRRDEHLRRDTEKALTLHGSDLKGLKLEVVMAIDTNEYVAYPTFKVCQRCRTACHRRILKGFYESGDGICRRFGNRFIK